MECFKSKCEMKNPYVKLIIICETYISYVKNVFRSSRFHMWNFEPVQFTCELGISCQNFPPSYVKWKFYKWNFFKGQQFPHPFGLTLRKTVYISIDGCFSRGLLSPIECAKMAVQSDFGAILLRRNSTSVQSYSSGFLVAVPFWR